MVDVLWVSNLGAGRSARVPAGGGFARRMRGRVGVVGLAVLLALVVALAGPAAGASARSSSRAAALSALIRAEMAKATFPGAIVGVWQRGAAPYVKAFGVADTATGQPMSTNLYMRIGSVTKTFTGTALLQLVEQGKVRLESPISRYIAGVPHGNAITIREVAEMRSGIFDYFDVDAFTRAWLGDPRRAFTPRQLLAYSFSHPALRFAPGTSFNYSNVNTTLLGLVVEKVSHQPIGTYIKQHILKPEHLTHTSFPTDAAFPSPHAQGYTNGYTVDCAFSNVCDTTLNATDWNPSATWAAGAMISTVGDLHRWTRDVATGKLLTKAAQKQRSRFIPNGFRDTGYGLQLENVDGWIGHTGSWPGYATFSFYLPSQDATFVLLLNFNNGQGQPQPGSTLSTSPIPLARAITRFISPKHVYDVVPSK